MKGIDLCPSIAVKLFAALSVNEAGSTLEPWRNRQGVTCPASQLATRA